MTQNRHPVKDQRRRHDRFTVNLQGMLRCSSQDCPLQNPCSATILDIAPDSLTCLAPCKKPMPIGTKLTLEVPDTACIKNVNGTVYSSASRDGIMRVGIRFLDKTVTPADLVSLSQTCVDRRKIKRRQSTSDESGKREFDRRGVWPGLLSKRLFSHHAWQLKNEDVYFFMKPLESAVGSHIVFGGREMIMMASNNYLGLNTHPKVREAAIQAIKKYGTGSSGSNLVGGTYDIHLELEETLARFIKVPAVCIAISGYVANSTTLATILDKKDAVFNDELNHASLMEGSLRTGAYFRTFLHNNMEDLERKLARCDRPHKLVVADAVFSMDGDIVPLPEMSRLCKKYNAALMLDQAHATGVFGDHGRGVLEYFNMDGKADIIVGTMSKSLAAIGGFIGGSKELINILRHSARQIFFSTNVSPSACASVLAALKVMEEEPDRLKTLWRNTEQLRSSLQAMGFDTGPSQSPIIPVIFPTEKETNLIAKALLEKDIYVTPILYPAVPKDKTRIRLSVIATHTEEDIAKTLAAFKSAKSKL